MAPALKGGATHIVYWAGGGLVGPTLDGVGKRLTTEYIAAWLRDPAAVKPGTRMPKLPLTDKDITELSAFLSQQK